MVPYIVLWCIIRSVSLWSDDITNCIANLVHSPESEFLRGTSHSTRHECYDENDTDRDCTNHQQSLGMRGEETYIEE